jgi:hypothetical protein
MSSAAIDDAERLRIAGDSSGYGHVPESAAPVGMSVLGITKTVTTYPTSAGVFMAFQTATVMGDDSTEGAAGTVAGLGDTQYALIPAGATIPATGTPIVFVRVAHRWVADL